MKSGNILDKIVAHKIKEVNGEQQHKTEFPCPPLEARPDEPFGRGG